MSVFPSNSIPIFILLCFTILLHIPNVTADEETLLQDCSYDTYESGSQFQTNLNHLLSSLVSDGSRNGYFNTSVGKSPDIVYGLAQCRGDLSMKHCRTCLKTAEVGITQNCANGMSATLRYDRCMLRYSDITFFSEESTDRSVTYYIANIADEYLDHFSEQLQVLMKNLSNNVVSTPTRYSFGQTNYAPLQVLYGAAQCTRDLSQSDCDACLVHLYSYIPTCCNASEGAKIVTETCYIRYNIKEFVESSSQSPPGNDGGKSFNVLYIIVAIIVSIMLE